ncbi:asparagine synthase-related protein [Lentzea sp. HUAS TT2]|uniref:asparagine synthase-related protein n=1 Tax=Lentzea sp. HUAS TT2 TaxID=3447454 RepID=UPI003F6F9F83
MFGQHASPAGFADAVARVRTLADVDAVARSLVGSVHLVASVGGRVRVQGTVSGVRRVFHARVGAVSVAADRADVLAGLAGAELDEVRLAIRLLQPSTLHPLSDQPMWRGVDVVTGDRHLVLEGARRPYTARHWTPPEPLLSLDEGAVRLREALVDAVLARVRGRVVVSSDLGGADSTAVCCTAAQMHAPVVACTLAGSDPCDDDVDWARRTASQVPGIEHHVVPADEIPTVYDGLLDRDEVFDEPSFLTVDCERWLTVVRWATARGSQMHLTGFGGDDLLAGSPANVRAGVRQLRGFMAQNRWSLRRVLRQVLDTRPYGHWLTTVADGLNTPAPVNEPALMWDTLPPRLPPWVRPQAVEAVGDLIRAAARTAEPLSPRHGQHQDLAAVRFGAGGFRYLEHTAEHAGVRVAAPYYDDRVIEAALAVRPEQRVTPWRYKPLIATAMTGIVPAVSISRHTKADSTGDEDPGLRRNRSDLLALWEDSHLGRLGLIDTSLLRDLCSRPLPAHLPLGVLYQTVGCEVWLRTLARFPASTRGVLR